MNRYPRELRLKQIESVLLGRDFLISSGQLAKLCGMSASPHFRDMLDDLRDVGVIDRSVVVLKNGKVGYYWYHTGNAALLVQDELAW